MRTTVTDLPPELLDHITQFVRITDLPAWISSSKKIATSYAEATNQIEQESRKKIGYLLSSLQAFYLRPTNAKDRQLETFLNQDHEDDQKIILVALYVLWKHSLNLKPNAPKTGIEKLLRHFQEESSNHLELSLITGLDRERLINTILYEANCLRFYEKLVSYNDSIKHGHLRKFLMIFHPYQRQCHAFNLTIFYLQIFFLWLLTDVLIETLFERKWEQSFLVSILTQVLVYLLCVVLVSSLYEKCDSFIAVDEHASSILRSSAYNTIERIQAFMRAHDDQLSIFQTFRIIKPTGNSDALTDLNCQQLSRMKFD